MHAIGKIKNEEEWELYKEKKYIEAANKSRFKKMVEKYMRKGIRTSLFSN
jgi:hypothetical protein